MPPPPLLTLPSWLTHDAGVTPIPPSAFYTKATAPQAATFARFAFCKTDPSLEEARKRLRALAAKASP